MRSILVVGLLALAITLPALGAAGVAQASPEAYLVGYRPGGGDDVARLVKVLGGVVAARVDTLEFIVATGLSAAAVSELVVSPLVTYAEPDKEVRFSGAQWNGAQWNGAQWDGAQWNGAQWNGAQWNGATDLGVTAKWGLAAVRAPLSWDHAHGPGSARLCVVDSGVDGSHVDLADNMANVSYDAIANDASADDDGGHGSHVAGIAAAVRGNDAGGAGVSDGKILPVKVLEADGRGTVKDLVIGMAWCADHGADVALLALSVDGYSRTIERALDYLEGHNVVVVGSAGNGGCSGCVSYPASDPRVLAVAAIDANGARAAFSSSGPEVDLAAPGVDIASTFADGLYARGSGTSQAAAFAAGAALAVRDESPGMPAPAVRDLLARTASDLGPAGRDDATGAGLLDVEAALEEV